MEKLKAAYLFSPIYEEFVRKLVVPVYGGDFSNAQHLRDLIKISSSVLGRAIDDGESTLVSIAHIEHDDIKHCLQEDSAKLWWSNVMTWNSYIDNKYQDLGKKKTLRYAVRSIYVKSVTDNVVDLIEMLRLKPETLIPETISRRALHQRDLILSLVGAVKANELGKLHGILDELENMPYIHVIRRDDARYYLTSFVSNPLQVISSIGDEILKRLRDQKGELDIARAINYLREKLREYMLVGQFKEKALLNFEFIKLGDFDNDSFLKYLDNSEFTVLLISPLEVEDNYLIIRKVKLIPPPSPPRGPRGIKGFTISGINDVTIFLISLAKPSMIQRESLFEKIRSLHVHAELEIEEQEIGKSVAVIEFKGPIGALYELAEHLVNYFNRHRDGIKQCNLQVELASEIGEEIVKQELKKKGISNMIPQRA
jgi:hypothetical protein